MVEYQQETDKLCPKCGSKLLADNIAGFLFKCSNETCDWKGDDTLLMFLARLPILERLLLDQDYRERLRKAKTWAEINCVIREFEKVCGEKTC